MSSRVDRAQTPLPLPASDAEDTSPDGQIEDSHADVSSSNRSESHSLVQGMLGVVQRLSASLLARHRQDRFEPKGGAATASQSAFEAAALPQAFDPWNPNPEVRYAVPTTRELLSELAGIRKAPITSAERDAVLHLNVPQRRQFAATLRALEAVKAGKLSSGGYFLAGLQSAAEISGEDRALFVDLVHLSFSDPARKDRVISLARRLLGLGKDPAGEILETTFRSLAGAHNTAADGFNANIVDAVDPRSTITHHFAEFLKLGSRRPEAVGDLAVRLTDRAKKNPGDVRNGLFSVMLGHALAAGKLTPREAVAFVKWAMLTDPEADESPAPPWGNTADPGRWLRDRDYDFTRWNATFHGHAH